MRILILMLLPAILGCSRKPDLETEKQEIMNVIETETRAFFAYDLETWKNCFLDTSYFKYIGFWEGYKGTKGLRYHNNYDSMIAIQGANFELRKRGSIGWNFDLAERKDLHIQVSENLSYVTFTEVAYDKATKQPYPSSLQVRILEKHDGKWKLAYSGYYFLPDGVKKFNEPF